jgi:2-polyprenyl-3-methyl-5-hydroxy-6-metoxy-1,4-benzoquinol methylase
MKLLDFTPRLQGDNERRRPYIRAHWVVLGLFVIYVLCKELLKNESHHVEQDDIMRAETVKHDSCHKLTEGEKAELVKEVSAYEADDRFVRKIREAKGELELDTRGLACVRFLEQNVLVPGQSVLDLGSAAGAVLDSVRLILAANGGQGRMVGVELVGGWVKAAKDVFGDKMEFYQADITDFHEIDYKFDVIMMNDVIEHVQPERYGCLFSTLEEYSHPGTAVYMHIPSPEAQLVDDGQFFENVLPHHILVSGMANAGFQLEYFSFDHDTECQSHGKVEGTSTKTRGSKCVMNGAPKYTHFLFRRVNNPDVLIQTRKSNE